MTHYLLRNVFNFHFTLLYLEHEELMKFGGFKIKTIF